jgi:hypothetical protein
MASTIKIKRSSIAGKVPTTGDVATGEMALNLKDGRLYSSNGASVFEIGANPHSLSVGSGSFSIANGSITFPTSDGSANQVLVTNGSGQLSFVDDQTNLQSIGGHLLPSANVTYDIGSSTMAWRSLYLSGDTIFIDNTKIQTTPAGDVRFADAANNTVSIEASTVTVGGLKFSGTIANGSIATVGANGAVSFTTPEAFTATPNKKTFNALNYNDTVMIDYVNGAIVSQQVSTLDLEDYVVTGFSGGAITTKDQVKNLQVQGQVVTQLSTSITIDALKDIAAAADTFDDFKTAISAL